jgi:hypothetical protein
MASLGAQSSKKLTVDRWRALDAAELPTMPSDRQIACEDRATELALQRGSEVRRRKAGATNDDSVAAGMAELADEVSEAVVVHVLQGVVIEFAIVQAQAMADGRIGRSCSTAATARSEAIARFSGVTRRG